MNCPHCNTPLVATARFCPACGKATAPTESGSNWVPVSGTQDLVGREIAGRYRIIKKLGEGGMGAVYRGEQILLKRAVAVKLLRPELGNNQLLLARFNAEAQAVAKLSHPNTVIIYDFGQDTDGSLFIAMEYIEGRSLRDAIAKEGPFSPTRALAIALQISASLSDAHAANIVHRDLKPDNVMLQDRGKHKDVVRVLDFGIAKLRDDSRQTQAAMTQAGDMLGTPQYMAPEQIRGETIDGRTDVYALGCIIYEMVTARLPFEAPTIMAMLSKHLMEPVVPPSQRRRDLHVPPAIDQLVLAAMAKDPAARPPTMDQLSEMLHAILATLPPDPNRSSGLSVQQAAVVSAQQAVVAPTVQTFQPHAFPPPPNAPPYAAASGPPSVTPIAAGGGSYAAPAVGTPTPFAPSSPPPGAAPSLQAAPAVAAKPKSRAPFWIVLGTLALAGAGIGLYFAMSEAKPAAATEQPSNDPWDKPAQPRDDDPAEEPDEPDEPDEPAQPAPPAKDHWAHDPPSGASGAKPPAAAPKVPKPPVRIGTAKLAIPTGAHVIVPAGFTSTETAEAHMHVDTTRGIAILLAPLDPGTNEPKKLAQLWTAQSGAVHTGTKQMTSAGKRRTALTFKAEVNGVAATQVAVLYLEPNYRLGVIYIAPSALFSDPTFRAEVDRFFANNVIMP